MSSAHDSVGVVLIHGGLHTGECWQRVMPLLEAPSIAPDLRGRGARQTVLSELRVADVIKDAVEDIKAAGWSRTVIVAHSLGGIAATGICEAIPDQVAHVVYISAVIPRPGLRPIDDLPGAMRWVYDMMMRRQRSRPDGRFSLPKPVARRIFCSDLSPSLSAELERQWVPDTPWLAFDSAAQRPIPEHIGRTYVRLTADRALPPLLQNRMIRNAQPVNVISEPHGHTVMMSNPLRCAEIINKVVAQCS